MVAVVIPVFNRKEFTRNCLLSLEKQSVTADSIIVVDDGSTDGTAEMLAREFPYVTVIHGKGNWYWTAAINVGIRYALRSHDYILTMNNDTVADADFIANMKLHGQCNPLAILGALDIDHGSKKPYYGGEVVNTLTNRSRFLLDVLPEKERHGLHKVSFFPGRGLWIPGSVFTALGLFDEKEFPHYLADYEFTSRARRNGFDIFCNYDARIFSYPKESGDHQLRHHRSIKNYYQHLFGIKGGGNLKTFTVYTIRNSPSSLVFFHLMMGYTQRIFGYFLH